MSEGMKSAQANKVDSDIKDAEALENIAANREKTDRGYSERTREIAKAYRARAAYIKERLDA